MTGVTQGSNGTVTFTAGDVTYTPAADFFGSDSFTYNDLRQRHHQRGPGHACDTATVTITVTNVNDDPVANDDTATVAEDSGATPIDVLANDNDGPDVGETLTVTAVDPAHQRHGQLHRDRRQLHARTPTSTAPTRSPTPSATATAAATRPPSTSRSPRSTTRRSPMTTRRTVAEDSSVERRSTCSPTTRRRRDESGETLAVDRRHPGQQRHA